MARASTSTGDRQRDALTSDTKRLLLRKALRDAREAAGLELRQVIDPLAWSMSKIIRIEQGAVSVSIPDLRALMELYGIQDSERRSELEELARGSRKRTIATAAGAYTEAATTLFGLEPDAETIHKYEPTFVPGVLQTEEYARALLLGLGFEKAVIDAKVQVRLKRQEILEDEDRPRLRFVIGEPAVSRRVGSAAIMRRQLERLIDACAQPRIELRILKLEAGAHPRMGTSFTVLEFADEHLGSLLYLENADRETVLREHPDEVSSYLNDLETLREMATTPDETPGFLREIIKARFVG